MLCLFSYLAAGQENKKILPFGPNTSAPRVEQEKRPASPQPSPKHQTEPVPPQASPKTVQNVHLPQQPTSKLQTVVGKPIIASPPLQQPPPIVTKVQTVQPTTVTTTTKPNIPARPASVSSSSPEPPKIKAPVLPQRVQSQGSVGISSTSSPGGPTRGPPPAIPPRTGITMRADSVQIPDRRETRQLKRQISATSVPPVVTPQAAPQFVIPPQRTNSRGSITRQGSMSGNNVGRKS